MTRIYYRGAKAAIVCYDITNSNTFQKAKFWVRELRAIEDGCKVYICATKKDILEHNAVPSPDVDVVQTYADGIQAKLFVTSSKTGENVGKDINQIHTDIVTFVMFISLFFTAELFNDIAQDFMSDPNNVQTVEERIEVSKEPKKTRCCGLA